MQESHRFSWVWSAGLRPALECKMVADAMYQWGLDIVENIKKGRQRFIHHTKYLTRQKVSGYGKLPEERSGIG